VAKDKKGLGRGLSSLLGGYEGSQSVPANNVSRETKDETVTEVTNGSNNVYSVPSPQETKQITTTNQETENISNVSRETITVNEPEKVENNLIGEVVLRNNQDKQVNNINKKQDLEEDNNKVPVVEKEKKVEPETKDNRDVSRETNENYLKLNIEDVEPNPDQPRRTFDEQKLQELAHSIQDQGVLQPIVVRKKGDKYQIIAGERRWQAARIAGLKQVPCVLQEANDDKALELALIENIQRDDLNPIEEAYTYKRLMDKLNYTQAELAKAVAKGRSTIANAIRLLDLPEEAQEAMFNDKLTAGHARAVLSVPNAKGRKKLTEKIIQDKLSVREAESLARLLSVDTTVKVRTNKNNIPSAYTAMAKSLKEVLGTQVRIRRTKSGSKLEISFSNEEELRKIYEKLSEE
jgi:ParB family transcriptional regulator, chromosome partitioning protein